ncbi:GTP pyrophosphokinase family protein [Ruminococcus sp. 5_1_39BFAA]|uniref:GTP pyrophosphokinase n=1 Tax=Ruminococcus sp. 5_1_39BFAA TaxID=457412 RepID=UPI003566ECDB
MDNKENTKSEIIEKIRKDMRKDQYLLQCQYAISIVEAKAKIIDEQLSLKYQRESVRSITGRIKSPESIYAKLMRKELDTDLKTAQKTLNDLIGVRIVCLFLDDVYEIADILKKQKDIQVIKEKDYISKPKKNGYMSLHLIVDIPIYYDENSQTKRVEIQIRTIAMDFWSVLEYQLMYKKNVSGAEKASKELKNYSEEIAALDQKMMKLRNRIDEI